MANTITIEFTDEEYEKLTNVSQKYGKSIEEYCQALLDWVANPENKEQVEYSTRRVIQEEKRKKFNQLIADGMKPIYASYHAYGRVLPVEVKPGLDYTLIVKFNNGDLRRLDCKRYINGTGAFLQNKADFYRVQLNEYGVIYWEFDPNIDSDIV